MKIKESEAPAGMRLYSPLVGAFYDSEDHCTSMDGYALSGYDWTIKKALEKDWIQESRAGLAEYLDEGPLKEKVVSMHPAVEVWNYCLWGVLKVECREELSPEETERLKSELALQTLCLFRGQFLPAFHFKNSPETVIPDFYSRMHAYDLFL